MVVVALQDANCNSNSLACADHGLKFEFFARWERKENIQTPHTLRVLTSVIDDMDDTEKKNERDASENGAGSSIDFGCAFQEPSFVDIDFEEGLSCATKSTDPGRNNPSLNCTIDPTLGLDRSVCSGGFDQTAQSLSYKLPSNPICIESFAIEFDTSNNTTNPPANNELIESELVHSELVESELVNESELVKLNESELDNKSEFEEECKLSEKIDMFADYLSQANVDGIDNQVISDLRQRKLKDKELARVVSDTLGSLLDTFFQEADCGPSDAVHQVVDLLLAKSGQTSKNIICGCIGRAVLRVMKGMRPADRTPMMSLAVRNATREEMESLIGESISHREWRNANIHFIYPGPGKPVPERAKRIRRKRVRDEVISEFVEWLYASDLLESLSFGQKVVKFSNGFHFAIESIKRKESYAATIRKYAEKWMAEAVSDVDVDVDVDGICRNTNDNGVRCCRDIDHKGSCVFLPGEEPCSMVDSSSTDKICGAKCRKSGAQCIKREGHAGRHQFTPEGKLSPSTIASILQTLTNGEIKSLAGLDNIDVIKGHENFEHMRSMVQKLAQVGRMNITGKCKEVETMIGKIDRAEKFHKYGFPQHLGGSTHKCACFHCGLSRDVVDPISCPLNCEHLPPCKECQNTFQVIADLEDFHQKVSNKLDKDKIFAAEPCLQDDMDTWGEDIKRYHQYLLDYRAHIVHKEDETISDTQRYRNLAEDECIVILDYKVCHTQTHHVSILVVHCNTTMFCLIFISACTLTP